MVWEFQEEVNYDTNETLITNWKVQNNVHGNKLALDYQYTCISLEIPNGLRNQNTPSSRGKNKKQEKITPGN